MLRNAPIRTKLIASLLGPLLVLAVVGLVGIRQNQAESHRAARSTAFARLAAGLAPLIHELQAERSLSISYIDSDRKAWGQRLAEQRRRLDRVAASYRASAERLGADDRLLGEKIEYGLAELGRLDQQRQAIDTAPVRPQDLEVGRASSRTRRRARRTSRTPSSTATARSTPRARRWSSTPTPSATCSTSTPRSPPAPTTRRC
jgi:hypothetical protein